MLLSSLLGVYVFASLLYLSNSVATVVGRDMPSLSVPLRRRTPVSKRMNQGSLAAMAHNLRQKYNLTSRSLNRRQGNGAVAITDVQWDLSYSVRLSIGTPGSCPTILYTIQSSIIWHNRPNIRCYFRYGLQRPMAGVVMRI